LLTSGCQLEKLLQKNYYLHQSARDGFRAYLQAYASYSLKKIYNVNELDLAKVGKAFGFAVPPRVNIKLGEGISRTPSGKKRHRGEVEEESEEEEEEDVGSVNENQRERRRDNKSRRVETLGRRKVQKEVFRSNSIRPKDGIQWTR
jgi:ATP-dependent RNA helicase DDX18/HAS1